MNISKLWALKVLELEQGGSIRLGNVIIHSKCTQMALIQRKSFKLETGGKSFKIVKFYLIILEPISRENKAM
jgi:hypothetical protein